MSRLDEIDRSFRSAVAAIDAGDVGALKRFLAAQPGLVRQRLEAPGAWLRSTVGDALEGYFSRPYLLWFVAENPIRNGRLPTNIVVVTRVIVDAVARAAADTLHAQLTYAVELVSTGRVARESGVQLVLIDTLIDAGAAPEGAVAAIGERNLAAAQRLIERGGRLTLAAALCLGHAEEAARLATTASAEDRQIALTAAALNGNAEALERLIAWGVDLDAYSCVLHPHATPLHQAVNSGRLDAVRALVEAGAKLDTRDRIFRATPLGWAEYFRHEEIAGYLRARGGLS